MKMCLYLILLCNVVIGCDNVKSNNAKEPLEHLSQIKSDTSLVDKKKVQLIETVLNLPDVIRFSKIEFIREKYGKVYIFFNGNQDSIPSITQNGHALSVLHSLDSLDAEKLPCYHFRMELKGDTAYVKLLFDITGAIAFGNLSYVEGQWVPDEKFFAGVR